MSIKEEIWIEKYRPAKLDDIVGQDEIIRRLKSYVKTRNLPHLLFSGPPGVGKTAASISIVKEIFGDSWRNNFIELNASDERGIDIIRHKVKDFARMAPLGEADFKVIFLDEADALTNDAQTHILLGTIKANISKDAKIVTDEFRVYAKLPKLGYNRQSIKHGKGHYSYRGIHTNTIEGFWSILKRGIVGSFHKVSAKYLPLYVAEFQFRYNNRMNADIFGAAISNF